MSRAVTLSCRRARKTSVGKPPCAPSRRNEPICAWPLNVSVMWSASGTSQTPSRRRCQNGKSGFTRFRGGPKRRSKTPSSRAISSYGAKRTSFRRHRPIAHNASKGLFGARHPCACQTLRLANRLRNSPGVMDDVPRLAASPGLQPSEPVQPRAQRGYGVERYHGGGVCAGHRGADAGQRGLEDVLARGWRWSSRPDASPECGP